MPRKIIFLWWGILLILIYFSFGEMSTNSRQIHSLIRNGVKITAEKLPADSLQQLISADLSGKEIETIFREMVYFRLTIGYVDDKQDLVFQGAASRNIGYSEWLQRLSYNMSDYISLYTAEENEIPLGSYQLIRTFGLRKDRTLLLTFPAKYLTEEITLVIKEFGLGTGQIKLSF